MILYNYYRSTASYRVRIALSLKNISYEKVEIDLTQAEQRNASYLKINPQGYVPVLAISKELIISQSFAIISYLEDNYPEYSLLPKSFKTACLTIANIIACDIHPVNNLSVLQALKQDFGASAAQLKSWYHHWLEKGFVAIEKKLAESHRSKSVCFGDSFTLADVYLIPQVYNAKRYEFDLEPYPLINEINAYCLQHAAFATPKTTHP